MPDVLFENAVVFDGVSENLVEGSVFVRDGRIEEIAPGALTVAGDQVQRVNVRGRTLMPGLIDAHVHVYFPDVDPEKTDRMPMTAVAHHARRMLEGCARRGFTTVRDCGGADYGIAMAIDRGWINGPRVNYCGPALSQTGGHGDKRLPYANEFCACGMLHGGESPFKGHRTLVVDGVSQLRRAVREELRRGASFVKIMGSGGVASPADPIHLAQYSAEEISAVVDEAKRHDVYVTAHIHPDGALRRAIELGVECIEHGTLITAETAALATERNVSVVPTLAVIYALSQYGEELGFPKVSRDKLARIAPLALGAVERLKAAGTRTGFGTDLIGNLDTKQCIEFGLRREVLSPLEIMRSATSVNAQILRLDSEIGRIAPGYKADMIVVDGNPLEDVNLFDEHGSRVPHVMRDGKWLKFDHQAPQ